MQVTGCYGLRKKRVLQGVIGRLIESGRCYRMEMNVHQSNVVRITKQPSPVKIRIDQKRLENVEYFTYLGSMINDARCTLEIKPRIAMAKAAFSEKKALFTSKLDLYLRKKLVKCHIWSISSYGAETWALRKVGQKYFGKY
jgi:hypothetical protein